MDTTDRLRAVVAIQGEIAEAGHDSDAVARILANRAGALVGCPVELSADGDGVPLMHGGHRLGVLRVLDGAALEEVDLALLEAIAGVAAVQLDYAQVWRDGRQDPVTGLLNRRAYDETLARETARARRHRRPLALSLFDLDDFKSVNDEQGHLAGDEALREFAGVLRGVRGEDFAFRVGGDEFALLLPETDRDGAITVTRRMLERSRVPASVGTATVAEADEPRDLHAAADAALYAAKGSPRRRGAER